MNAGLIQVNTDATGKAVGIDTYWANGTTLNFGDDSRIELTSGTAGGSALYLGKTPRLTRTG